MLHDAYCYSCCHYHVLFWLTHGVIKYRLDSEPRFLVQFFKLIACLFYQLNKRTIQKYSQMTRGVVERFLKAPSIFLSRQSLGVTWPSSGRDAQLDRGNCRIFSGSCYSRDCFYSG